MPDNLRATVDPMWADNGRSVRLNLAAVCAVLLAGGVLYASWIWLSAQGSHAGGPSAVPHFTSVPAISRSRLPDFYGVSALEGDRVVPLQTVHCNALRGTTLTSAVEFIVFEEPGSGYLKRQFSLIRRLYYELPGMPASVAPENRLPLRRKPVPGRSDMIYLVPEGPVPVGLYALDRFLVKVDLTPRAVFRAATANCTREGIRILLPAIQYLLLSEPAEAARLKSADDLLRRQWCHFVQSDILLGLHTYRGMQADAATLDKVSWSAMARLGYVKEGLVPGTTESHEPIEDYTVLEPLTRGLGSGLLACRRHGPGLRLQDASAAELRGNPGR